MPEVGAAELELDARRFDIPFIRQISAPVPAVAVLAVKRRVGALPLMFAELRTPHRLRTGTGQRIPPETLQFASVAGVDKFVVVFHLPLTLS